MELDDPGYRRWDDAISHNKQLIRYDNRASGLSDRDVVLDWQALELDIGAVADRLGLEKFALSGTTNGAIPAILYAAHNPERVTHLLLWCTTAQSADLHTPGVESILRIRETDWYFFLLTAAQGSVAGWGSAEDGQRFADMMMESIDQDKGSAALDWEYDLTDTLADIRCPTLILQRKDCPVPPTAASRHLASHIPNAELVLLEGGAILPWVGDMNSVVEAFDGFLGVDNVAPVWATSDAPTQPPDVAGTAIILFADIADSTGLTERLGDAAFRAKARELDGALRTLIREHAGTAIEGKLLGDGVLAVFTSARQAIEAALASGKAGDEGGLPLHLGLHAGDVIREDNNVYGGAVNIAARISGLSAPGEVLVSETVRSLARTSAGVRFEDRGEQELKGVGEAVRVWAVRGNE
jgi:class 3 adenylate cyclase